MAINILPPETAAKIAAGEVVERPASIAKELIENSIDAGATRIDVEVRAGGISLLRVVDNGCGMSAADASLAFHRYATSKLSNASDLEHVTTHGFRGEALPSIAAVADVSLLTRPHDEMGGAFLRIAGGQILEQASRGAPPGTSITVRALFRNVPARLKFLKSNAAESGRIGTLVTQFALAYPEVHFSLRVDGRVAFESEGDGDPRQVAAQVYGVDVARVLLPVVWEDPSDGLAIRVSGLVSPPSLTRSSRTYISLFVNRRLVQSRSLTFAIEDAYQGMLMVGRHPVVVLDLAIDPSETDVNVHPSKMEIKFRDEGVAFSALRKAVQQALVNTGLARPATGGGLSTLVSPPGPPSTKVTPAATGAAGAPDARSLAAQRLPLAPAEAPAPVAPTVVHSPHPELLPRAETGLPILRPLGQVGRTYIVAEGPDGMYLIDQHAAHERVLFDQFRRDRARGEVQVQGLLEPITVELTYARLALLEAQMDALKAYGFGIEHFGPRSVLLRSLPATLMSKGPAPALLDLLDTLGEERLEAYTPEDRILTSLACHSAVRAGEGLDFQEMEEMVRLLEATDNPRTCPHGRPTILHMSSVQLEKEFGRR